MKTRKAVGGDAKQYLDMLLQIDEESKFMMYEPNERTTTLSEVRGRLENMTDECGVVFVADDYQNATLAGFVQVVRGFANRNKHSAYIVIGIKRNYAKRGIGVKLFEHVQAWAEDNSISRLELTVMTHNAIAIRLYEKMGFEIEGVKKKSLIVDGKPIDEYYMGKLL